MTYGMEMEGDVGTFVQIYYSYRSEHCHFIHSSYLNGISLVVVVVDKFAFLDKRM